jgi:penicillin amidase
VALRWNGSVDPSQLLQIINPAKGYLATANDDLQDPTPGAPKAINYHMGFYRKSRIDELIEGGKNQKGPVAWTPEDMKRFQLDVYSKQAEYYMELLAPLLEERANENCAGCRALLEWDKRFDKESVGAAVFASLREAVLDELFGGHVFGRDVWTHATRESGLVLVFQWYFDRALLWDVFEREGIRTAHFDYAEDNPRIRYLWNELLVDREDAAGKEGREGKEAAAQARRTRFLARVVDRYLVPLNVSLVRPYGARHAMLMKNIFFNGELPAFLGFDVGPIPMDGSGATVNQVSRATESNSTRSGFALIPPLFFILHSFPHRVRSSARGAASRASALPTDSSPTSQRCGTRVWWEGKKQ